MMISKTLEDAINKKNMTGIHSVFYTIVHEDPAFRTGKFEANLEYVRKLNLAGFIAVHNNEPFLSSEEWDEKYWALVASQLLDNFSLERIEHLKEVGRAIYDCREVEFLEDENYETVFRSENNFDMSKQSQDEKRKAMKIFLIGAAIVVGFLWLFGKKEK